MQSSAPDSTVLARYRGDQGTGTNIITGALLCGLAAIALLGALTAGGQIGQIIVFLAFAAFLLRFGGRILWQWWRNRGVMVEVYEDRLVRTRAGEQESIAWDDIRAVWQTVTRHTYANGAYRGMSYLYTVETRDKQRFEFGDDIVGIDQLGRMIQQQAHQRLYPQLVEAYEKGENVWFGPFTLSKDGITHKNQKLMWAEIEGAKIAEGYMVFKRQDSWLNWANVAAGEIPNLPTFLNLIDHIIGLETKRA